MALHNSCTTISTHTHSSIVYILLLITSRSPCQFSIKIFNLFLFSLQATSPRTCTCIKDWIQQNAQIHYKSACLCLYEHIYAQLSVSASISISQSINQKAITFWAAMKLEKSIQTSWEIWIQVHIFAVRSRSLYYGEIKREERKKEQRWVNE